MSLNWPDQKLKSPCIIAITGATGIASDGLRETCKRLQRKGYNTYVFGYKDWQEIVRQIQRDKPDWLGFLGHSFGGGYAIEACIALQPYIIPKIFLLEPTMPPLNGAVNPRPIPNNVLESLEIYCVPQTPLTANQGPRTNAKRVYPTNVFHTSLDDDEVLRGMIIDYFPEL